jgi:hypothetical protein
MMAADYSADRADAAKPAPCLLVALLPEIDLRLLAECPGEVYQAGDRLFRDQGFGDWTGFYDWLRDARGEIIGVRYWPFADTQFVTDRVRDLSYARVAADRSFVEIRLRPGDPDQQGSDDQDFGNNRLLTTSAGELALSFGTGALDATELGQLRTVVDGSHLRARSTRG